MEMTYHVKVQRAERVKNIIEKIGMGQVVKTLVESCSAQRIELRSFAIVYVGFEQVLSVS